MTLFPSKVNALYSECPFSILRDSESHLCLIRLFPWKLGVAFVSSQYQFLSRLLITSKLCIFFWSIVVSNAGGVCWLQWYVRCQVLLASYNSKPKGLMGGTILSRDCLPMLCRNSSRSMWIVSAPRSTKLTSLITTPEEKLVVVNLHSENLTQIPLHPWKSRLTWNRATVVELVVAEPWTVFLNSTWRVFPGLAFSLYNHTLTPPRRSHLLGMVNVEAA